MRILLTGASGFLGRCLAASLSKRHTVIGTWHRQPTPIPGCELKRLDIGDEAALMRVFSEASPELAVHAGAMADPEECEERPQEARRVNVEGSAGLARACRITDIPLIFISTDLVFDGKNPPYAESAVPNPLNLYARTKREAELQIAGLCPGAALLRFSLCFGWKSAGRPLFTDKMFESFSGGQKMKFFSDQYRTPLYVEDAAEMIALLADLSSRGKLPTGALHAAGPQRLSRFEFARIFCRVFGFRRDLIEPARTADIPLRAPRPADCGLDGSRLNSLLGYKPRGVEEALLRMRSLKFNRRGL